MRSQSLTSASVSLLPQPFPATKPGEQRASGSAAGALTVLVVEDDELVRRACSGMAETQGCRVWTSSTVPAARKLLTEVSFDVVFLDVRLPGGSGDQLLREVHKDHPHTFVVMMTAFATVNSAVDLMRSGAAEFLQKPFGLSQVADALRAASRRKTSSESSRALKDRLASGLAAGQLVGTSEPMQKLFRMISKIAYARHPALILGERGTGREAVARSVHANGPHPVAPFVPVDCDSLRPERLEGELFGSATGAEVAGSGLLARAGHGTIYLSEISHLAPQAQARLVRTLNEKQIQPATTGVAIPLQARLLASSSRELLPLVETGKFRKDLFYRLNVVTLRLSPLRERVEDIPALAEWFLEQQRREHGRPFIFSEEFLEAMMQYPWAGNVQEMEALISRACRLTSEDYLHLGDMSTQVKTFISSGPPADQPPEAPPAAAPLVPIQELERRAIQEALRQLNGDKLLVAKCLGIGKTTLYRKLKEYGLMDERVHSPDVA